MVIGEERRRMAAGKSVIGARSEECRIPARIVRPYRVPATIA